MTLLFSFLNYSRGTKKIETEETSTIVSLQSDIKYMSKQLTDISDKLVKLEDSVSDVNSLITENKTNIVTLYKKYDELRNRLERLEENKIEN